ncbi:MAG TPA: S9 family peptidase [Rhodanobacteraceae bacterium]|nr:S9 family peptidase [Rhodanobacteraceae bacterium]
MNAVRDLLIALLAMFPLLASADIPLADFARHAQFRSIKISPAGDYLAASVVVDDKSVLSLIHLSDMKGVNVRPRDQKELADFWWVAPDRVMYTVGEKVGGLEAPAATGELFAVDADGGSDGELFGYRMGGGMATASHIARASSKFAIGVLVDPLRDDPEHALIASYAINGANLGNMRTMSSIGVFPDALRIDLDSGKTAPVTTSPLRNAQFLTDHEGIVRFAYGEDEHQSMQVWYRAGDDADWQKVFDERADHVRVAPMAFNRKQDAVYFGCGGAHDVGGVCRWNIATRKLTTLWSGSVVGPDRLLPTFDDRDVFAIRSMPGRAAITLLDKNAPEAQLLVALMQQFPGEDVEFTSHSRDGKKVVVLVESGTDPGRFYQYDSATGKLRFLVARAPWIKPAQMAKVEPIELKARDGLALHGYLTRPAGKRDAKNLPLVVFVHGGPYGVRDRWQFDPYVQMLASRGYAVLQVNYRGSGGYGDAFERAGFRQWGGAMQDDVTDATRWAIAQGIADPKRICIFGGSYGGYAAIEGAVKEPDLYRCAIGYVGVYDLRLMYTRGDIPQFVFGKNYLEKVLGTNEADLWARSPIARLDRLKAKVMLIVGGQDKRVPPIQGEHLHAALEQRHVEHEWLYRRAEAHGYYDEGNLADLFEKVAAFLDRNIGSSTVADATAIE